MPNLRPTIALCLLASACVARGGFQATSGGTAGGGPVGSGPPPRGDAPVAAASATKLSDFAFEVKDATGEYNAAWVIDKLTTFEVAPACYQKMLDRDNGAVHAATFYTRDVAEYAKGLTGDDWSAIEAQNNNDRETNKHLIEPMIDRFRGAYHMTVTVAGDDCDARRSALWIKYWTEVGRVLKQYPPASGKAFVKLAVVPDARDIEVQVDDATSTFTITAPRDIEKAGWDDKISKPFRKRARSN